MDAVLRVISFLILPSIAVLGGWFGWSILSNKRKKHAVSEQDSVMLSIEVPKESEKGPVAAELMFAALHGILKDRKELRATGGIQEHLSFEMESKLNSIKFFVWVPKHLKEYVEGQIYAQYPTAEIKVAKDYTILDDEPSHYATTEIKLTNKNYFPIKTFDDFEVDPLAGITGVLSSADTDERIWVQILVKPLNDSWHKEGLAYTEAVRAGKSPEGGLLGALKKEGSAIPGKVTSELLEMVTTGGGEKSKGGEGSKKPEKKDKVELHDAIKETLKAVDEKLAKLGYEVKVRAAVFSDTPEIAKLKLQGVAGAFKQFNTTMLNGFTHGKVLVDNPESIREFQSRAMLGKGNNLNVAELASLYHLPYESVATPTIVWAQSKKGEPPADLPIEGSAEAGEISLFGQTNFRTTKARFGLKRPDRFKHTYIIGKSGMGKSELLKLFIISDLIQGKGVAVIDPHGELAEEVLQYVPESRKKDVVYFNPADPEYAIGFNPLEAIDPDLKYHVASGFISIFKKLFGWTWGPRLEHILRYTVLALMDYPNSTMLGVVRMLTDKNFRKKVRKEIKDPAVKNFWQNEFESYNEKFATEAVAPILNKVGQFVATPVIRTIVGQPKSTIDLNDIINNEKIFIVNLSSGKLGEDNAALLGAMMVTKIQLAAMHRAHISKEERKEFYLYVDEFQNFATDSFAVILSEARKYNLALTIANQYIAQMPEEGVKEAVFGNVGTMITFRVGAEDAKFLEKEFEPTFEAQDLVNLGIQNVYVKMAIDGQTSSPFSATTLVVPHAPKNLSKEIIEHSRTLYGRPKVEVEEKISRWQGLLDAEAREAQQQEQETRTVENREFGRGGEPRWRRDRDRPKQGQRQPQRQSQQQSQQPTQSQRPPQNQPNQQKPIREELIKHDEQRNREEHTKEIEELKAHEFEPIEAEDLVVEYDKKDNPPTVMPSEDPKKTGTTLKPGEPVNFRKDNK